MTKPIKINLNDMIEVTLTDTGLVTFRAAEAEEIALIRRVGGRVPDPREFDGNVWRGSLWEAMQIFGDSVGMGMRALFEGNEIRLIGSRR